MVVGKTYKQLYWDEDFIRNRIEEQEVYALEIMDRWADKLITFERAHELTKSTSGVLDRLKLQLVNIKKLE